MYSVDAHLEASQANVRKLYVCRGYDILHRIGEFVMWRSSAQRHFEVYITIIFYNDKKYATVTRLLVLSVNVTFIARADYKGN